MRGAYFLLSVVLGAACTPEATVVDPQTGGSSGASSAGSASGASSSGASSRGGSASAGSSGEDGGSMSQAGMPDTPDCSKLQSPRAGCADCLPEMCPDEVAACDDDCRCQFNCLMKCETISAEINDVNACAKQCGFQDLGGSAPTTRALFDCLVNPPMGPPVCMSCFPPRQQP